MLFISYYTGNKAKARKEIKTCAKRKKKKKTQESRIFSQQSKLTEGDPFSLLLIRLLQLDVVKHGKVGKNVGNLATTMKAYGQFKIPSKKHEPASSRTCNIL